VVSESAGTVLVVDQVEEVITTPLGPPIHKRDFFIQLEHALREHLTLRVVLAFREEYLSQIQQIASNLSSYWVPYRLERLSTEGLVTLLSVRRPWRA
jgi:hypothetical protein